MEHVNACDGGGGETTATVGVVGSGGDAGGGDGGGGKGGGDGGGRSGGGDGGGSGEGLVTTTGSTNEKLKTIDEWNGQYATRPPL